MHDATLRAASETLGRTAANNKYIINIFSVGWSGARWGAASSNIKITSKHARTCTHTHMCNLCVCACLLSSTVTTTNVGRQSSQSSSSSCQRHMHFTFHLAAARQQPAETAAADKPKKSPRPNCDRTLARYLCVSGPESPPQCTRNWRRSLGTRRLRSRR